MDTWAVKEMAAPEEATPGAGCTFSFPLTGPMIYWAPDSGFPDRKETVVADSTDSVLDSNFLQGE
jgi:hypothetical protein